VKTEHTSNKDQAISLPLQSTRCELFFDKL